MQEVNADIGHVETESDLRKKVAVMCMMLNLQGSIGMFGHVSIRVPGTAVFMTAQPRGTPPALAHNLRYNKILHEHVVVLTVSTAQTPYVDPDQQVTVESLGHGVFHARVNYGFMQDPLEYASRTHHSNMDLYDRVQAGDVMQGAALEAWFVYTTATRPEMLPRNPVPSPTAK